MKKLFIVTLMFLGLNAIFANEYNPVKITSETNTDVAMYFENMDMEGLGITAVQTNVMPGSVPGQDLIIKSETNKIFTITKLTSTSMVQALDSTGKELAYMHTLYTVNDKALIKLNKLIKNKSFIFSKILNSISNIDVSSEKHGTQEPPDPKTFAKLRNVQVFDIYVTTEDAKVIHLQVYIENFRDAKDL